MPHFVISAADTNKLIGVHPALAPWFKVVLARASLLSSQQDPKALIGDAPSTRFVSQIWRDLFKDVKKVYPGRPITDAEINAFIESLIATPAFARIHVSVSNFTKNPSDFAQADVAEKTIEINRNWLVEIGRELTAVPVGEWSIALEMHFSLLLIKIFHEYTNLLTPSFMAKVAEFSLNPHSVSIFAPKKFGIMRMTDHAITGDLVCLSMLFSKRYA